MDVRSEVPEVWQRDADEVVAHLVALRGRGLFLSSADAQQLVRWLEQGVGVPAIVLALERAAAARQGRPSSAPLRLTHAKRHLGRPVAGVFARERPRCSPDEPLSSVARALSAAPPCDALVELQRALGALGPGTAEALFRRAAELARAFLEARWLALGPEARSRLEASARRELGELVDSVDDATLEELVDEGARALLRAGYPALSAASLWEAATAGARDGA